MANGIQVTQAAESYLEALADDLGVSEARYREANDSYNALGEWFHREKSTIRQYKPQVYVQGSFRLGTAIRPIDDREDYDVDSICEFRGLTTADLTQKQLKELLGTEIHSYHRTQSMTKPVREGRRCWVLNYADGAQFHMDIVPALPDANRQRLLLEMSGFDARWTQTAIAITDNERADYAMMTAEWQRSNPKGYSGWFVQRMGEIFETRRRALAESVRASVEDIPVYRVQTPLQSAIMILKRHRDWRFAGNSEIKPISVIITTLAAHAYEGEATIGEALTSILTKMDSFLQKVGGQYVIPNPTDPLENFADKWVEHPERAEAFFQWLQQARSDFLNAVNLTEQAEIAKRVAPAMGDALAERVRERAAKTGGGLLRKSSVAPVTGSTVSFPDQPRMPTTPKGFA